MLGSFSKMKKFMNDNCNSNQHPWQLKKSKAWGPFWSYQLNGTANLANLVQF
jgi:hypothetical protein